MAKYVEGTRVTYKNGAVAVAQANGMLKIVSGPTKGSKRKYPKCVPRSKANQMTEGERQSAVKRKRAKAQGVGGKPTNVATFKKRGSRRVVKKADGGVVKKYNRGCGAIMPDRRKATRYS